jgi:hypothetical protein
MRINEWKAETQLENREHSVKPNTSNARISIKYTTEVPHSEVASCCKNIKIRSR